MVKRDSYMERLIRNMWNGEIKVITGIRRCGKSVLLFDLFYEYLLSQNVSEDHILKIELDQRRYYKFRNPITLCEYVESAVLDKKDDKFYLFIDEVQLTTKVVDKENGGIEVTIYDMLNELKAYKNLDVYVTGSNSKGLSKDIATEFRGRATQIHVFPLSFAEFYSAVGGDERKALDTYMLYGGMPRLLALEDDKDKKDYLTSLYSELYVKDIVERNGIEREDVLNDILDFLASQISLLTNPTNIANAIASMKNEKNQSCDGFKLCAVCYRLFPHFNGKAIRCQRKDLFQVSEQILLYGYRTSERTTELPPVRSRSHHGKHHLQ